MHVAALRVDLRLPNPHSLKEKRAVIKPILEGSRRRFSVTASEVGNADQWQRSVLAFAAVSATASHVQDVLDEVERFIWSFPEVEVLDTELHWLET